MTEHDNGYTQIIKNFCQILLDIVFSIANKVAWIIPWISIDPYIPKGLKFISFIWFWFKC